jgi:hypothetical protein
VRESLRLFLRTISNELNGKLMQGSKRKFSIDDIKIYLFKNESDKISYYKEKPKESASSIFIIENVLCQEILKLFEGYEKVICDFEDSVLSGAIREDKHSFELRIKRDEDIYKLLKEYRKHYLNVWNESLEEDYLIRFGNNKSMVKFMRESYHTSYKITPVLKMIWGNDANTASRPEKISAIYAKVRDVKRIVEKFKSDYYAKMEKIRRNYVPP